MSEKIVTSAFNVAEVGATPLLILVYVPRLNLPSISLTHAAKPL